MGSIKGAESHAWIHQSFDESMVLLHNIVEFQVDDGDDEFH